VVRKSVAICGKSESVTRTCAWLAKPAAARRMMERTGVWRGADDGLATDTLEVLGRKKRKPSPTLTPRAARVSYGMIRRVETRFLKCSRLDDGAWSGES
jgi:hypothetical protein